ncbi:hypothetical protein [Paragemmobacter ruber]|uniref:DUF2946 domain-containing protein n=1 Tax=Paragemmobacter ruber TaxID=1985673 RepID=A0ABW9Y5S6_9RHOB|nr:hypothetical protein [Rhodobacter ruber]NBE07920.1 hypothetical protein [Rhodobacter ruber]
MVLARFPWLLRAVMALTLALGLAGAGAAHRPLERPEAAAALAAFVAAGGSLADLCHEGSETGHGDHGQIECPACVLQKGMAALAATARVLPAPMRLVETLGPAVGRNHADLRSSHRPPVRGPPVFLLS